MTHSSTDCGSTCFCNAENSRVPPRVCANERSANGPAFWRICSSVCGRARPNRAAFPIASVSTSATAFACSANWSGPPGPAWPKSIAARPVGTISFPARSPAFRPGNLQLRDLARIDPQAAKRGESEKRRDKTKEAPVGVEPTNGGFANRRLTHGNAGKTRVRANMPAYCQQLRRKSRKTCRP